MTLHEMGYMIELVRTEEQYQRLLSRIDQLIDADPAAETPAAKELEVLTLLVKDFERRRTPLLPTSPIAAIRVRMDQRGMTPRDLVPFLGTRSRVSEVLAGKRPLSLTMIRALHTGLGIPLEALVSEEPAGGVSSPEIDWDLFPVREMARRGWLSVPGLMTKSRIRFEQAREAALGLFGTEDRLVSAIGMLAKADRVQTARASDRYALADWSAYVLKRAESIDPYRPFRREEWTEATIRELRGLSRFDVGPRLATQFLGDRGIIVDIVPHLPKTRLDGAALLRADGTPVIALTLRRDRLDNFWFTLFHELMHVLHHLKEPGRRSGEAAEWFLDDLEHSPASSDLEEEADREAKNALLPLESWERSAVRYAVAPTTVRALAAEVGVGEAIVAGRVRHERKNYRLLSAMVGADQVRRLFPEVDWSRVQQEGK